MPETVAIPQTELPPDEQPTVAMDAVRPDEAVTEAFPPVPPAPEPVAPEPAPEEPSRPADEDGDTGAAGNFSLQVVDASSAVDAGANDYANAELSRQTTQRGFKGFLKKIWHGNLAREYMQLRYRQEGRQKILDEGMYVYHGGTREDHNNAVQTVVSRFVDEHLHSGETQERLSDTDNAGRQLEERLKELVLDYARSDIDDEALAEEKTRLLDAYKLKLHAEYRHKGLLLADNVLDVARNAKAAVEHGMGLEELDAAIKGYTGEARMGQRTEMRRDAVERTLDALHSTKAGSLVNETTIGAAAAIALGVSKVVTRRALTAALAVGGMGIGAGAFAAAREYVHIGKERTQHLRERAIGGEVQAGSKRRERLEETRYNTVAATDLHDQLQQAVERIAVNGRAGDPLGLKNAVETIMAIDARIRFSDEKSVDLVSYSSALNLESERLGLDIALAEAKVAARHLLENAPDELIDHMGVSRDFDAVLANGVEAFQDRFNENISAKDAVFAKLRMTQAAKMGLIGAATGVAFGLASQEIRALMSDSLQGVFENANGADRRTLLAGLFSHNSLQHLQGLRSHDPKLSLNSDVNIPDGYHLEATGGGHWELLDGDHQVVADHLAIGKNGAFTHNSKLELEQAGFRLHAAAHDFITHHVGHSRVERTPEEFLQHHRGDFTHVQRQLWYDNNTPGVYDQNELRLDWGADGAGVDAHGNFVFSVADMTPGGSFHDGLSANAQQLIHEGKMAIALSMTRGTEAHVVLIHVNEHGQAIIPAHSWMARSMFKNEGGHAQFTGAYAEAVQLLGKHDGAESVRMLATVVGEDNVGRITDTVSHLVTDHHEGFITTLTPNAPHNPIEVPPVIPLYGRRGLEQLTGELAPTNPNLSPMYYGGKSLAELREWIANNPGRLQTRTEVRDQDGTVRWVEADGSEVVRSVERERQALSTYIDAERATNPTHIATAERVAAAMAPMNEKTRVSINVPAWMEAGNLDHFLQQYADQLDQGGAPLDPDLYEINILVNRKTGTEPDRSVEVIAAFIDNFERQHGHRPPVNFYDIEIDPPYNTVGYARKLLTDAVVMRSLSRRNQQQPLYFETEDADLVSVDKHTVVNLIDKLDRNPQFDAVRGVQDRAPAYMQNNDYLFLRRRAWDFFEIAARNKKYRNPQHPQWNFTWNRVVTGGWNTGYTAEAYALIGGYEPVEAGEDMSVGEKITMVRGDGINPNLEVVGTVATRSNSSPRRFIHEILTDRGAYEDFGDEDDNQAMRERSMDEALQSISQYERITPENQGVFSSYLNNIFGWAQSATPTTTDAIQLTKRVLFFLGFRDGDYELTPQGLHITSYDNVEQALERYRQRFAAGGFRQEITGALAAA